MVCPASHLLATKLADLSYNAFCATGKGGGVNPTCSPKSRSGSAVGSTTREKVVSALKAIGTKANRAAKKAYLVSSGIAMDAATTAVALHEVEYILHGNFPETAKDTLVLQDLALETIHVLSHTMHKIPVQKAIEALNSVPAQRLKDFASNAMDAIPMAIIDLMQSPLLNSLDNNKVVSCVANFMLTEQSSKLESMPRIGGVDSKLSDIAKSMNNSKNPNTWSAYYVACLVKGLNHMESVSVASRLVGNVN